MSNEALFDFAASRGHEVVYRNLAETKAITYEDDHFHIALAKGLSRTEEKEIAAHELGHCEYGGTYCRSAKYSVKTKAEYRASKWAYYQLVSPDEITECVSRGIVTPWELAEHFDVSDEFMCRALGYYQIVGVVENQYRA
jgi:Zn-dependent peptidase ImmA (M78 family)